MQVVLLSGGSGLLGNELMNGGDNIKIIAPPRDKMDIENYDSIDQAIQKHEPAIMLHAAAFTRPMNLHEERPDQSIKTNIIGTSNVTLACIKHNVKLVYISTDYVYPGKEGNYNEDAALQPINAYAWSKLGGECAVHLYSNSLILRAAFTTSPFPHDKAFVDSYKSYVYVQQMAQLVLSILETNLTGVINVGGERKSVYEFASISNPEIGKINRQEVGDWVPEDVSMNIDKLRELLNL